MSEIAYRFCQHATIVAVITLIAGIAVALDAIGSARGCPPLAETTRACGAEPLPAADAWPAAARASQPDGIDLRRG